MRYFALGLDGIIYDLGDCNDIEDADDAALEQGVDACWLADEATALRWAATVISAIADTAAANADPDVTARGAIVEAFFDALGGKATGKGDD